MNFKKIKKECNKILNRKDGYRFLTYLGIYAEIFDYEPELNKELVNKLIEEATDFCLDTDYATSTGVGVVLYRRIERFLEGEITEEELLNYQDFTYEYFDSEWR